MFVNITPSCQYVNVVFTVVQTHWIFYKRLVYIFGHISRLTSNQADQEIETIPYIHSMSLAKNKRNIAQENLDCF
jgi:hypothetical protein